MSCGKCLTRRQFLEVGSKGLGAIALAGPAATLMSSCGQQDLSPGGGVGPIVVIPNSSNNIYLLNFSDYPALQAPGGSIHALVHATSGDKDVFITRVSTNVVDTVSTICTHTGCTIGGYNSSNQQYLCPCHNSIFAADGSVVQGPATSPLPSYVGTVSGSSVQITIA